MDTYELKKKVNELFCYDENTGILSRRKDWWREKKGSRAGHLSKSGYREVKVHGKTYAEHRIIWLMVNGEFPMFTDHINHVTSDNRLCNLREVTPTENNMNTSRRKDSKITGVSWAKQFSRWIAYISVDGKMKNLGYFKDYLEACACRKSAELKYGYHKNHGSVK